MEKLPLRNSAVFHTLLRPGKLGQTSNPPRFTKSDTDGEVMSVGATQYANQHVEQAL